MPAGGVFLASPHKCLGGSALALGRRAERSYGSDMAKEWATACSGLTRISTARSAGGRSRPCRPAGRGGLARLAEPERHRPLHGMCFAVT